MRRESRFHVLNISRGYISIYDQMIIVEKTYDKSVVGTGRAREGGNDANHRDQYAYHEMVRTDLLSTTAADG